MIRKKQHNIETMELKFGKKKYQNDNQNNKLNVKSLGGLANDGWENAASSSGFVSI